MFYLIRPSVTLIQYKANQPVPEKSDTWQSWQYYVQYGDMYDTVPGLPPKYERNNYHGYYKPMWFDYLLYAVNYYRNGIGLVDPNELPDETKNLQIVLPESIECPRCSSVHDYHHRLKATHGAALGAIDIAAEFKKPKLVYPCYGDDFNIPIVFWPSEAKYAYDPQRFIFAGSTVWRFRTRRDIPTCYTMNFLFPVDSYEREIDRSLGWSANYHYTITEKDDSVLCQIEYIY